MEGAAEAPDNMEMLSESCIYKKIKEETVWLVL